MGDDPIAEKRADRFVVGLLVEAVAARRLASAMADRTYPTVVSKPKAQARPSSAIGTDGDSERAAIHGFRR